MNNNSTEVYIDNFRVDTASIGTVSIRKQLKDIKDFAKRKTSFSKPIKVLHTINNSKIFSNAFNINSDGTFNPNDTAKGRIVVNNETVLNGLVRLDSMTKDYYNIVIYSEETNLTALFGSEDLRGNDNSSKDLVMQDTTQHTITFDSMRTFMNSTYPNDGSTLYWGWSQLRHHNGILRLGDDVILPSVPAREVLVDLLASVGKTVTLSPEIEKYIKHMVLPFNSEYTELTTPWLAYMYNFGTPELSDEKLPKGQFIWKDLRVVFDHYSKEAAETSPVTRSHIRIRTRGTHEITMDVELRRSIATTDEIYASPRAILKFNDGTTEELKLEGDKVHLVDNNWHEGTFTASFNTQSIHDVDLYFGHTPIETESNNGNFEIKGNVGIVHRDAYYSGDKSFTKSNILPVGFKKRDFFTEIIKTFNAVAYEEDNNITIQTYNEYLGEVTEVSKDWSNLIDVDSISIQPIKAKNPARLEFKMGKGNSLYVDDYISKEEVGISDKLLDKSVTNKSTISLASSATFGANLALLSTSPEYYIPNVAILADKGSNFTTKNKARMLFTGDGQLQNGYSEIPKSFGTEVETSVKNVINIPILSTRYSNDLEAADNFVIGFGESIYYSLDNNFTTAYKTRGITGNSYSRFYQKHDFYNSELNFLKAKFNLSAKDVATSSFNDKIYINMGKNGSGVFRINSILDYKPGANALTTVELVQVNTDLIASENFTSEPKTLVLETLSVEADEVKKVGATGGTGSASDSGVSVDTVNDLIAAAIITKLDVDGKAADSELLDGHDSLYFATQADLNTKANLDGGNTFTGDQEFSNDVTIDEDLRVNGNFTVEGNFTAENTTDLAISDNVIDLNKGEAGAGVSARFSGIQVDRGSLLSKGLVFDEDDDKIKFGDFDTRSGAIASVGANSITLIGLDTTENLVGKLVKVFTLQEVAKVLTVTSWDNVTKVMGVTGDLTGVDNTWNWRLLIAEDLHPIPTYEGGLTNDNGVVWNGSHLEDAGYKWALKNGDTNEDFYAKIGLFTAETTGQAVKVLGDRIVCATDGDAPLSLGLNNDSTVKAKDDGSLEAINIHSETYISGIGGKGTYNFGANSECDNLAVRESLTVNTFVNNKINIQNGDMIVSDSVEIETAVYNSGNGIWKIDTKENIPFSEGDKVRCQYLDGNNVIFYIANIVALDFYTNLGRYKEMEIAITEGTGTPDADQLLARWSGGLLYLNSSDPINGAYFDVLSEGVTKARFGNLTGINDPDFGQLQGDGAYIENLYGKGDVILGPNSSIDFANVTNAPKEGNRNLWILKTAASYYGGDIVDIQNVTISDTKMRMFNSPANYVIGNRITMPNTDGGDITISGKTTKAQNAYYWQAYDANDTEIGVQEDYFQNTPDKTFEHTITLPAGTKYVNLGLGETITAGYYYTLDEVKVELGNTKSAWTLSSEDAGETNDNFMLDSSMGELTPYCASTIPSSSAVRATVQDGYPCIYFDNVGYYTQTAYLSVNYRGVPRGLQNFTVSMDMHTNSEQTIWLDFDGGINTSVGLTHSGGWQRVSKTFSFNVPSTTGRIAMYAVDTNSTFTGFVKNVKLEVSTIPTPWIASPQDVLHRTTHIDANGIYAGHAVLGGFDVDSDRIKSVNERIAMVSDDSVTGFYVGATSYGDASNRIALEYRAGERWGLKGTSGGDTIFELGSTNKIADFTFNEHMIRSVGGGLISPTGRKGHISMSNTTTAYGSGLDFFDGDRTLQGFSMGSDTNGYAYNLVMGQMMDSRNSFRTGYFGIQMMDSSAREYFALGFNTTTGDSYNKIAGWDFDNTALSSPNNALVLDSATSSLKFQNNAYNIDYDNFGGQSGLAMQSSDGSEAIGVSENWGVYLKGTQQIRLDAPDTYVTGDLNVTEDISTKSVNGVKTSVHTFNSTTDGYQKFYLRDSNLVDDFVSVHSVSYAIVGNDSITMHGANEIIIPAGGSYFWYNRNDSWGDHTIRVVAWGE